MQFGHRQRLQRRVTEPNKLDECSFTLHHWSPFDFDVSFRERSDTGVVGTVRGSGVRNANEIDGGEDAELDDELEFNDAVGEPDGEFDDERIAANEWG